MKRISVVYCGWGERWQLGTLADNGERILFEYHPEALAQGLELSPRHLKLSNAAYGDFPHHLDRLPGLISDSLPDGWGMLLMDRHFRRSGINPENISVLDRLAFVGDRAMGALTFEPHENISLEDGDIPLLEIAKEIEHFISGDGEESLKKLAILGGSPHGARPKAMVLYDERSNNINAGTNATGTPWLVKFPAQYEHKEVCAVEYLYSQLAVQAGIEMPPARYFDLGAGLSAFAVKRFDRQDNLRVPTHTLAGLLHANFRIPSVDYVTFLRATRFMTQSDEEVGKAYLRCVFNVAMHNRDDHSKNVSFLLNRDRRWKLSPGYDLTYSLGPGGQHQMSICGEGGNPGRAHLLDLAKQADVKAEFAKQTIDAVSHVASQFAAEAATLPIRKGTIKEIDSAVRKNLARLK